MDRLEQKLDGLVTLLTSATQNGPAMNGNSNLTPTNPAQDQLTPTSLQSLATTPGQADNQASGGNAPVNVAKERDLRYCPGGGMSFHVPVLSPDASYSASGTRSGAYHAPQTSNLLGFEPSIKEAEEYLNAYIELKAPYFPLLVFQTATTALQLRQEKPFLWLCIMAISSKSSEQQKVLNKEIRLTIGREILLEGKNNFDLLLGLLVYTAWYVAQNSCPGKLVADLLGNRQKFNNLPGHGTRVMRIETDLDQIVGVTIRSTTGRSSLSSCN